MIIEAQIWRPGANQMSLRILIDVFPQSKNELILLHLAAQGERVVVSGMLIEQGPDASMAAQNQHGETRLACLFARPFFLPFSVPSWPHAS